MVVLIVFIVAQNLVGIDGALIQNYASGNLQIRLHQSQALKGTNSRQGMATRKPYSVTKMETVLAKCTIDLCKDALRYA